MEQANRLEIIDAAIQLLRAERAYIATPCADAPNDAPEGNQCGTGGQNDFPSGKSDKS